MIVPFILQPYKLPAYFRGISMVAYLQTQPHFVKGFRISKTVNAGDSGNDYYVFTLHKRGCGGKDAAGQFRR